jgi:hypothetical protein
VARAHELAPATPHLSDSARCDDVLTIDAGATRLVDATLMREHSLPRHRRGHLTFKLPRR